MIALWIAVGLLWLGVIVALLLAWKQLQFNAEQIRVNTSHQELIRNMHNEQRFTNMDIYQKINAGSGAANHHNLN